MTTSGREVRSGPKLSGRVVDVNLSDATLSVRLEDGRGLSVPLAWFPRLAEAEEAQRNNWQLIGGGIGIHWPAIDEDISIENLLGADGELLAYRDDATHEGKTKQSASDRSAGRSVAAGRAKQAGQRLNVPQRAKPSNRRGLA